MVSLPARTGVVIVGGGIVGCSVAYHLAKRGCTDVVLLERKQLTCGTTWHAAGLVGQLRATHNLTGLAKYTTDLFATLEDETEQATGFVQRGSVAVATNNFGVRAFKGNGLGGLGSFVSVGPGNTAVAAGDVNGDGLRDLVGGSAGIWVALNTGGFAFAAPVNYSAAGGGYARSHGR